MKAGRWRLVVSGVAVALVLTACSSSGGSNTTPTTKPGTSGGSSGTNAAGAPVCKGEKIGPIQRCDNFYTDFWPTIKTKMASLYEEAKTKNGGKIVLWDWYPVSAATQAAFLKDYPGLTIATKGLQYNIASSVVTAHTTGGETSDTLGGTWTIGDQLLNQGYNAKINWADYGVPKVWLHDGVPWFPWAIQGWVIQYNKSKVSTPPTDLKELLDPKYKGQIAMNPAFLRMFGAYGVKFGESAMVDLVKKLKSSGNLIYTSDGQKMLATGDVSIVLDSQGYSADPNIGIAPFQGSEVWAIYLGSNAYGANIPGASLFNLWRAFDPDYVKLQASDPKFAQSTVLWPGLPASTVDTLSAVKKENLDVWMTELEKDWAVYDTPENGEKLRAMQKAAVAAGGQ